MCVTMVTTLQAAQIAGVDWSGVQPTVNQCHMSVGQHDDVTIAYCAKNDIQYEAYGTMRSCYGQPWTPAIAKIAKVRCY